MRVEDPLCPSDISPVKGETMRGVRERRGRLRLALTLCMG